MAKPIAKLVARITPKRRWAQFSLATLLLVVTVLCVWLSVVVNRAHRQRDAVAALKALGGRVEYVKPDSKVTETFPRRFLRRWLPRDFFDEVQGIRLDGNRITDNELAQLRELQELENVFLVRTQVTDAGLAHLHGLTGLKWLMLDATHVTDAALAHLHGLTGMELIVFGDTQVTDAGLAQLRQALPDCWITGR